MSVLDRSTLSGFSLVPADHESGGYVIVVDKPYGWTSADVVRKVKFSIQRILKVKNLKVGHAGTLDPLATGILIVCIGKATKIAEKLQAEEKEYVAEVELGATTPSYDKEKEIDERYPYEHITAEMLEKCVKDMIGDQMQVPPIFSAKLVGGVRSYEMARQGEEVELKASPITIYDASLISYEAPNAVISVRCSKGTYIRAIARDLGLALESGGHLANLRRTASGGFAVANAVTMEDMEELFKIASGN